MTHSPPTHCWHCAQQGRDIASVRPVANHGYCATHLAALYGTFGREAWINGGIGLQDGPCRPEYGPLEADLRCCCCDATWTGIPGDSCPWCRQAIEIQQDHQHDLVLRAPEVDPDDATYDDRMRGWAQRMRVAVDAGIIEQDEAERAYRLTIERAAAS